MVVLCMKFMENVIQVHTLVCITTAVVQEMEHSSFLVNLEEGHRLASAALAIKKKNILCLIIVSKVELWKQAVSIFTNGNVVEILLLC